MPGDFFDRRHLNMRKGDELFNSKMRRSSVVVKHFYSLSASHIWTFLKWVAGPSWSWSYGSWIDNYLCNQCISPL